MPLVPPRFRRLCLTLFAEGAEPEFEHRSGKAKGLGTLQQYIYPMTTSRCTFYRKYVIPNLSLRPSRSGEKSLYCASIKYVFSTISHDSCSTFPSSSISRTGDQTRIPSIILLCKKQKRYDWDHKASHNAPSAIIT